MAEPVNIPLLSSFTSRGFHYGSTIVIEFDPHSPWYETSLTITADAIKEGTTVDYHTFHHPPEEISEAIARLGVDVQRAANEKKFRILDSYNVQLGVKKPSMQTFQNLTQETLVLSDWQKRMQSILASDPAQTKEESRRIHIDDNTSALLAMNDEKGLNDFWIQTTAMARKYELVMILSLCVGTASDAFFSKFEAISDAIVDIRARENKEGELRHFLRIRAIRGGSYNTKWKEVRIKEDGRAAISKIEELEQGLTGWLKGGRK